MSQPVQNELRAIDRFLYENLIADPTIQQYCKNADGSVRVFESVAPEGAATPFVVFHFQSGIDRVTVGAQFRMFSNIIYLLKAVNQEDGSDTVGLVASAMETAVNGLQNITLEPENVNIMGVFRMMPLRTVEEINGKRFSIVGGMFRIFATDNVT